MLELKSGERKKFVVKGLASLAILAMDDELPQTVGTMSPNGSFRLFKAAVAVSGNSDE